MNSVTEPIRAALTGQHPLLYVCTPEEERVVEALRELLPDYSKKGKLSVWTCTEGLDSGGDADTRDPVAAIQAIVRAPHEGFYVMKDLPEFMGRPEVVRVLRDAYYRLHGAARTCLVILSPLLNVPESLEREICRVELPLPNTEELVEHLQAIQAANPKIKLPAETLSEIALTLRGLTIREAGHVMHRILGKREVNAQNALELIFAEKKALAERAGFLEFIPSRFRVEDIGGLGYLKEWAVKRKDLFTQEAVKAGLPVPKGVLIMGVSGCGKSLSAKAIAALWRVPLFRLDMNLVFSGIYGNAQAAFHRALKTVEAIAPAVLWIDEIESALGMTVKEAKVEQSLIFSSFLTWMQERPPLVFVAATANRIESLPAEIIRKGRFDEVFFCDLPTENERREIVEIQLRLNNSSLPEGDIARILMFTEGWTGAEVEQAIVSARIDARSEGRALSLDDVRFYAARMVPLSQTMIEQIRAIRSWAYNRASRASREKPKPQFPGA
jgi:hypothetical protein